MYPSATLSEPEVIAKFETSRSDGLSVRQAKERLAQVGYNEIAAHRVQWWEIAIRQFSSPFIYLLLVASAILFVIADYMNGAVIFGFVVINVILGFTQEYKSEQSLRALQQFIRPRARVKRDSGWHTIESRDIVPGDIIQLVTGDMVPADIRILSSENLMVNETILTGESVPVPKHPEKSSSEPQSIHDSHNLCFSGTSVVGGKADALVVETGVRTFMGRIAKLTVETARESEFSRSIGRFSRFIMQMVIVTLAFVFVANVLIKGESADIIELLVFSIALVVSVVPEALPVVTTVSLSRGALRMAQHDVVVKRLTAIEDIGSIEVLCSDKTGTLTENTLTVTGFSPGAHPDLLRYATLTIAETGEMTEPFDIAIADATGTDHRWEVQRLTELPFDPRRRRNAVLARTPDGTVLVVRGAPEEIILRSQPGTDREALETWLSDRGRAGERTIAFAVRTMPRGTTGIDPADEQDLMFLGALAFTDPIKSSAFLAVENARKIGVHLKIVTGDSPEVAGAVGVRIGLIDDPARVMAGSALMALSPEEREQAVTGHSVFARVTPEQKYEIVRVLQQTRTVGFLGEGINDAPALKLAGVSLVVDSAADIAREAADIILLQKDLEVIIEGIQCGREVFANTVKYLKATLSSNFGNFYAVAVASLFIAFLPMLPIQILLVNLLSDFPMISIATDTVDAAELGRPRHYDLKEIVLIAILLGVVSTVFDFAFFAIFVGDGEQVLQTCWFIGSILTELVFLFSIRTRMPFFQASRPSGYVIVLTGVAAAATILLPYTTFGQEVFRFVPPPAGSLAIILGLVAAFFITAELVKISYYRYTG